MADYYRALGVKKDASADEIKKTYRRLAKKYHPDATGGDKEAEKKFVEINKAYETLGDPDKRKAYDAQRADPFRGRARPYGNAGPSDGGNPFGGPFTGFSDNGATVDDLLNDLFGGTTATQTRARPSLDVHAKCDIPPWLAALGGRIEVRTDGKTLSIKIPPNAKSGQKLRLRGQGLSADGKSGDLVLELTIQNPSPLTAEMRALYERLAALEG